MVIGCTQPLLHDLPETEANALINELALAGVRGTKTPGRAGRFEVHVAPREGTRAWEVANAAGYPREREVETAQRLVLGPREAAALERRRKASQLSALLRRREGVVDARVVLDPAGAAVLLRIRQGVTLNREAITALVRAGGGLDGTADVRLDTAVIHHGQGRPPTPAAGPTWPLRLATIATVCLSIMCLFLLGRIRSTRRRRG